MSPRTPFIEYLWYKIHESNAEGQVYASESLQDYHQRKLRTPAWTAESIKLHYEGRL